MATKKHKKRKKGQTLDLVGGISWAWSSAIFKILLQQLLNFAHCKEFCGKRKQKTFWLQKVFGRDFVGLRWCNICHVWLSSAGLNTLTQIILRLNLTLQVLKKFLPCFILHCYSRVCIFNFFFRNLFGVVHSGWKKNIEFAEKKFVHSVGGLFLLCQNNSQKLFGFLLLLLTSSRICSFQLKKDVSKTQWANISIGAVMKKQKKCNWFVQNSAFFCKWILADDIAQFSVRFTLYVEVFAIFSQSIDGMARISTGIPSFI